MKIGGKNISNWWLIAGGGGVVLVWYLYKRGSSGSSSSSGTGIDPQTGVPYAQDQQVDPLTGLTYLQEAQQYGSVAAAEAAVSGGSAYGGGGGYYGSGGGGGYVGTAGYPTTNVTTPGTSAGSTFATNAAWAQAVQAGLVSLGYDAQTVAAALGAFFAGMPLTATQAQIIQTAEAEFGPPPQGTYNIIPEPSGGGGTPGSGGSGGSPPPVTEPPPAGGGPITVAPKNFRVESVNGLAVTLAWDPVQVPAGEGPLRSYVIAYGQSANSTPYQQAVVRTATSTTIRFNEGPGAHGLRHYFILWADPASPGGPHAGPISAVTK